jgi:hypothetical protein
MLRERGRLLGTPGRESMEPEKSKSANNADCLPAFDMTWLLLAVLALVIARAAVAMDCSPATRVSRVRH